MAASKPQESQKVRKRFLAISRERVMATLVAFLFICGVLLIGLRWFERAVTFHPVRYSSRDDWSTPSGSRDVWFTTVDGFRLHGWFFEPQAQSKLATVIYFHGNGGNITNVGWVGENLAARGFAVLLFDYRGYGRSEGEAADERDIYRDADAAYDFVASNAPDDSMVLYGQSLGTAAVADLASRRHCRAIVLESGFSSAGDVASSIFPWFPRPLRFLFRSQFDSARKLQKVSSPVLITHGDPDPVIPTHQSRLLFAAANEPKKLLIFPGTGHNVFGSMGDAYLDEVSQFIKESSARK
jgi:fermentation-respiration switch protein FrsA (DUF1100 family)